MDQIAALEGPFSHTPESNNNKKKTKRANICIYLPYKNTSLFEKWNHSAPAVCAF